MAGQADEAAPSGMRGQGRAVAGDDARRVRTRVRVGGIEAPVGTLRGLLALILVGTLVAAVFHAPPKGSSALTASLQTLSVSVIAFYFGSRSRKTITQRTGTDEASRTEQDDDQ
jgi:hypothetical protein